MVFHELTEFILVITPEKVKYNPKTQAYFFAYYFYSSHIWNKTFYLNSNQFCSFNTIQLFFSGFTIWWICTQHKTYIILLWYSIRFPCTTYFLALSQPDMQCKKTKRANKSLLPILNEHVRTSCVYLHITEPIQTIYEGSEHSWRKNPLTHCKPTQDAESYLLYVFPTAYDLSGHVAINYLLGFAYPIKYLEPRVGF